MINNFKLIIIFFLFSIKSYGNIEIQNITHTNANNCDGSIDVLVDGSANPYILSLNGGAPTDNIFGVYTFENLCPGDYEIVVTNAFNCEVILNATVNDCPSEFQVGFTKLNDPTSCNVNNGSIRILGSVSGGTSPYQYEWNNGMTGSQIFGLSGGTYTVTITDAIGCTDEETYELEGESTPELIIDDFLNTCEGLNNGMIEMYAYLPNIPSQNQPSFSYSWSTGATTSMINNLSTGTYCVTATNNESGCMAEDCIVIESVLSGGNLVVEETIKSACINTNSGQINLSVNGGNEPYTYEWNTSFPTNGQVILGKPAGTYCVTVTDQCNNSFSQCYTIPEYEMEITGTVEPACEGYDVGQIVVQVTSGIPSYKYDWGSGPQYNNNTLSNLSSGTYCVTVTDGTYGCSKVECFTVPEIEVEEIHFASDGFIVDFFGETVFYPTNCHIATLCGDEVVSFDVEAVNYTASDSGDGTCIINAYCGDSDNPFSSSITSAGSVYTTETAVTADDQNCYAGKYCDFVDYSNQVEINGTSYPVLITTELGLESIGQVSTSTFCPNPGQELRCIKSYSCNGVVIRQEVITDVNHPDFCCPKPIAPPSSPENNITEKFDISKIKSGITQGIVVGYMNRLGKESVKMRTSIDSDLTNQNFFEKEKILQADNFNVGISPNPFTNYLNVNIESFHDNNEKINIKIFNTLGDEIFNNFYNLTTKSQTFSLDMKKINISNGLYFVEVIKGNQRIVKKIIHIGK